MTYDQALSLDLGDLVEADGLTGVIVEITHKLDTRDGKRYLFFHIELTDKTVWNKTRGPYPAAKIRMNLLQRMAEAADDPPQ